MGGNGCRGVLHWSQVLPVVLHHGIFGYDELRLGPIRIPHFPGVEEALEQAGHVCLRTRVHPIASIARRARELKESILRQLEELGDLAGARLIVVAHSLGGLDARYMISHLGMASRVAALLTITTPHRGAALADFWHLHLGQRLPIYSALQRAGMDIGAALDLQRAEMERFNAATPDHPDVRYYSVTCSVPARGIRPKLLISHRIVEREEGENDGIVSVRSAKWGTHLDHWPVDHITALNRPPLRPPILSPESAESLDIPAKYLGAVSRISAECSPDTATGGDAAPEAMAG